MNDPNGLRALVKGTKNFARSDQANLLAVEPKLFLYLCLSSPERVFVFLEIPAYACPFALVSSNFFTAPKQKYSSLCRKKGGYYLLLFQLVTLNAECFCSFLDWIDLGLNGCQSCPQF